MNQDFKFNYIVTIHNKENLIEGVILHLLNCVSKQSVIYLVLDGCTDRTEAIVDQVISANPTNLIHKIYTDDVHELKAINAALRIAPQVGAGFNIILQDDILFNEKHLESKVIALYNSVGESLGIISFRHGANLSRLLLLEIEPVLPFEDYIESIYGHQKRNLAPLKENEFTYREIAVKSPICIPFCVVRNVGLPDEQFAPWDDINYCYEVLLKGYKNGVFALNFISKPEWGTMRTKQQEISHQAIVSKNVERFKLMHNDFIPLDLVFTDTIYVQNTGLSLVKASGRTLLHKVFKKINRIVMI